MSPRDVRAYLFDIAEACGLVLEFTNGKAAVDYASDPMLRSAVERQLEIVGEALAQALRHHPDLPLAEESRAPLAPPSDEQRAQIGEANPPPRRTSPRRVQPARPPARRHLEQVGCVHTARGFEFDYVGVILGSDLAYRPIDGGWLGQRHESRDRLVSRGVTDAEFTAFVKSTYRVLLTHGLRG